MGEKAKEQEKELVGLSTQNTQLVGEVLKANKTIELLSITFKSNMKRGSTRPFGRLPICWERTLSPLVSTLPKMSMMGR